MLIIRDEQMQLMRVERLLPVLFARLDRMGALRQARKQAGLSAETDEATPDAGAARREADFRADLTNSIREDVLRAARYGIVSDDGLLQFASFRFTLNTGSWYDQPDVRQVLEREGRTEAETLQAVYDVLARF